MSCLWSSIQQHLPVSSRCAKEMQKFWLPNILGRLLYTSLIPLSGADKVSGESWWLFAAVHDEGDGWVLCD